MDGVIYFPWDPARDAIPFPPKHDHTNQMNPSHKPELHNLLYARSTSVLFVDFFQNVQNGACTPRLRGTRVVTERSVLIRQLG